MAKGARSAILPCHHKNFNHKSNIRCEPVFDEEKTSKIIPPSNKEKERLFSQIEVC
jgi:hypothetical protein